MLFQSPQHIISVRDLGSDQTPFQLYQSLQWFSDPKSFFFSFVSLTTYAFFLYSWRELSSCHLCSSVSPFFPSFQGSPRVWHPLLLHNHALHITYGFSMCFWSTKAWTGPEPKLTSRWTFQQNVIYIHSLIKYCYMYPFTGKTCIYLSVSRNWTRPHLALLGGCRIKDNSLGSSLSPGQALGESQQGNETRSYVSLFNSIKAGLLSQQSREASWQSCKGRHIAGFPSYQAWFSSPSLWQLPLADD